MTFSNIETEESIQLFRIFPFPLIRITKPLKYVSTLRLFPKHTFRRYLV